ncbi:hypothetical protein BDV96DRAFT_528278 [Lophiotrema nucula]|uniref:RRM domain-containing protein n=1 Tax=Lophiotrema nucula TaxID=690887 RepID=A0A6A5YTM2_9PLEO|nr:hypothetical protein BDV96DRAFT_528278 [Lophiotrema nucula]
MIIASGPVHYAPFLAGWKEFKDNTRQVLEYQPGWTDVMDGPLSNERQGWCRIDRKSDAESAYAHYITSRQVLVHYFKTSRKDGNYRILKCNCSMLFPGIPPGTHSNSQSGIHVNNVNQYMARLYNISTQQYNGPTSTPYNYATYPQAQAYSYPAYATYGVPMPTPTQQAFYSSNRGLTVSGHHGVMLTEARGVFISGLSYSVSPKDLNDLISLAGVVPLDIPKMHKDGRTGDFKGVATVKFHSKEDAQRAAAHLNLMQHMGQTINVRLDTDATVVGQIEPTIVNGSNTNTA